MKQKLFTLFVALVATTALWAQNNVITYAATEKLIETTDNYSSGLHTNAFNVAISSHAFSHGTGTITFAGDVTTIGNYAFYYCSGLTSITIPNSVTMIGFQAFCECDILTSITIPNSVTTIGTYAFAYCRGLASITIGNSVTTIGNSAFENCVGLTKTNYTGTIADWCKISFDGPYANPICYSFNLYINDVEVKDLVIPNSVTTIGNYAFYGCSGLTSITIPNSVTMIGDRAFYNVNNVVYDGTASGSPWGAKCINGYVDGYLVYSDASKTTLCGCSSAAIGEITLPNSVTMIENDAFLSCSGLTSVTIPNSVTTIGYEAFAYCTGLTSVTIPNSVTTILVHAFLHVNNIIYSGVATCTYGKYWGAKCMNGYIEGFLVYSNASKTALCGCSSAATGEITLPYSVTTIGEYAFENCSSLTSVTIPNSVTTIGNSAFSKSSGLTSVTIPNSVTTIGNSAFSKCSGLTSVTIGNSVTEIGYGVFSYCTGLTSVTIPNSVTTIGIDAFAYCRGLTSVTIGNSVTTIGNKAFFGCSCLTSITIPNSVTTIEDGAFCNCSGLTSVTIPNSVTTIGNSAFNGCSGLTSVTIPNSVTTIGEWAFAHCRGLTSVTIPNSVKAIGDLAFYYCSSLTSVIFAEKSQLTTIGESAFSGCYGLTSVVIPNSVTTIGKQAFSSVQTITIPNWIKSLGYEWLGGSYRSEEKTVYVVISPFEYDNNPENLNVINPIIKSASYHATLIPQLAEVATWTTTPTTIEMDIDLTNIPTTHLYDSISIDYFGEEIDIEKILTPSTKNHVIFTGLTSNQKANIYYTSKKIGEDDWEEGAKLEIQLPKLNLTTLTPKVVSAGTAVVAAETNISDYETNVGFEWRKYDAPSSMPSKSGAAILFNGMMEGKLLNLGTDSYWNVRPYYEAADGTRYYGEWITFDPSDFSYFEPTVHTYALATSPTANKVQVRGYVMTGTDDVTEQGFEYWFKGGQKAPHRIPNATADSVYRVTASGQVMTAVLEDLAYSSTYTCRAYAIAGGKTYYGEEVQFLTPEDPRPIYTLTVIAGENGSVNTEVSGQYREGEQVTLTATPNVGYLFEQWSDGNTENPYILTIMQDTELTATFKLSESGLTNPRSVTKATKFFHNGNLFIERNGVRYTPAGQKVK